ncbi:MAG: (p)ppGpp synthetase [Treponema sp.]|nr:(p)ppGpp synthetase [Treponema sp.]
MNYENKDLPSKNQIKQVYESYNAYLTEILSNITNVLSVALKLSSRPTFKKRVKSFNSYYKKILRLKPDEASVSSELVCLTDMMGIRVICAFLEDINIAIEQIKSIFDVVEVEYKGAEKKFSEFGYESVHVLVRIPHECTPPLNDIYDKLKPLPTDAVCEIQIRTILQDAWAEVEHELIYKTEFTPLDIPLRRKLASLNASLSLADITFQEIRDYQNKLQKEVSERRNSFYALADNFSEDSTELKKKENISRVTPFVQGTIDEMILSAIHAHNEGHLDEAVNIYSKIIEANPVPPDPVLGVIHKHRGMAYFALNKFELAVDDFNKSINFDPKAFRTYYYKGIVLSITKNFDEAISCFTQSLELNEFQAHTHYRRALCYFENKEYEKSMSDLTAAIKLGIEEKEIQGLREKLVKKLGMGM